MNRSIFSLVITSLLFLGACSETAETPEPAQSAEPTVTEAKAAKDPNWRLTLEKPALMTFDPGETIFWDLNTSVGEMRLRLFADTAPMHVTSTIYLTEMGFYDGLIFHRVIPGFMAQGGDPMGNGRGNPGYRYDGEFEGGRSHDKPGILSMANAGPGTDGSQFFITFEPTPFLDGKHTIFGEVVTGFEVLDELANRGSRSGATSERIEIVSATIAREPVPEG